YVVPTGRVKVPAGRYVVPTGKDNVIVSAGRSKVIPAGRTILVLIPTQPRVITIEGVEAKPRDEEKLDITGSCGFKRKGYGLLSDGFKEYKEGLKYLCLSRKFKREYVQL
ncbi:hypothetical protein Tco_0703767, partial [Tanacetum coccineum]